MKLNKYNIFPTFEQAFKSINRFILNTPEFQLESRTGQCNEISNLTYEIEDATTYQFTDPKISRINYKYADTFFNFMIEGGTDAMEAFKDYPQVLKFIEKPKNPELPDNFNSLYGPRIKKQLPDIIKELTNNPSSRRAVILILSENDHILLDKDETIEYPCCLDVTYYIRNKKLHSHCNMRSQNAAIVLQLDMYLQGRLLETLAAELNLPVGNFSSTMVSAHIFERDFKYVKTFI